MHIKIGSRHTVNGEEYILAQIGPGRFALINLETGNRWNNPVKIQPYWLNNPLGAYIEDNPHNREKLGLPERGN